jgi:hypothetical protein
MTYQPKHQKQLNGSATAGEDCWVRSVSMAIDFATRGATVPSVEAIRNRAGVKSGSGNTADQEKAAESYNTPDETGDRDPVKYDRNVAAPWADQPVDAMRNAEKVVVLSLDYGVVNAKKPNLSGDPNFDGNHSVMFGVTRTNGETGNLEVKAFDSLYDGRRAEIPNGPQWWPVWLAREAAEAFAGAGKWTGGIIPTAWLLDDGGTDPAPEPPPDREAELEAALLEERAALVQIVKDANARIAHVDTLVPPNTSAATAVVSSGTSAEPAV